MCKTCSVFFSPSPLLVVSLCRRWWCAAYNTRNRLKGPTKNLNLWFVLFTKMKTPTPIWNLRTWWYLAQFKIMTLNVFFRNSLRKRRNRKRPWKRQLPRLPRDPCHKAVSRRAERSKQTQLPRAAVTAANVRIIIFKFWHKSSFSQCWILHLIFFDILSHPLPPFYIVKQWWLLIQNITENVWQFIFIIRVHCLL